MKPKRLEQVIPFIVVICTLLFAGPAFAGADAAVPAIQGILANAPTPINGVIGPPNLGLDAVAVDRVQQAMRQTALSSDDGGAALQIAAAIVNQKSAMLNHTTASSRSAALFTVAEKRTATDSAGNTHVRIQQYYQGIPVVGGQLIVHTKNGVAYGTTGKYLPFADVSPIPNLSAGAAVDTGIASIGPGGADTSLLGDATLVIFNNRLAYHFELEQQGDAFGVWKYYVDAHNGRILFKYNNIQHAEPVESSGIHTSVTGNLLTGEGGAPPVTIGGFYEDEDGTSGNFFLYNFIDNWSIFDVLVNDWEQQAARNWGTLDRAAISAANNIALTQDYVATVLGMDSFDGNGAHAQLNIHQFDPFNETDLNYVNAYWDGTDFHFGDGDGVNADPLTVLDAVAHEYGHAVTQYSSDLIYWMQSGALNEAYSDILGAAVEFHNQPLAADPLNPGAGQSDWVLAEDCWLAGVAMRSMANPQTYGDPSYYKGTNWKFYLFDNGGVHSNSGVLNKAFYLLAQGGTGTNDGHAYTLTGLGIVDAASIANQANLFYHTPADTYYDARLAWKNAADVIDPSGISASAVDAVFDAVGVPRFSIIQPPESFLTRISSQDNQERNGAVYVADDFTLTQSQQVQNIAVQGLLSNGASTLFDATTLNFYIYSDAGGEPDGHPSQIRDRSLWRLSLSPSDSQLNIEETYLGSEQYHSYVNLILNNPVTLPTGQYWLVFFPEMVSPSPSGRIGFYMAMSDASSGDTAQAMDTNNLLGWPATWTAVTASPMGAPLSALSFEIESSPVTAPTQQYTVTFDANANGAILGLTPQIIDTGKDCAAVTADSDTGYMFSHWTGDYTGTQNSLQITNVTSNMTIAANFVVAPQYTVTFVAGTNGTLSGDTSQLVYQDDASSAVTAVPNTGYEFDRWTGAYTGDENPLVVPRVTGDMTITATFAEQSTTVNIDDGSDGVGKGGGGCFIGAAARAW